MLRALLTLPLAATLDVEKLLWIPGQMVTVPAMPIRMFDHQTGIAILCAEFQRDLNRAASMMIENIHACYTMPRLYGRTDA